MASENRQVRNTLVASRLLRIVVMCLPHGPPASGDVLVTHEHVSEPQSSSYGRPRAVLPGLRRGRERGGALRPLHDRPARRPAPKPVGVLHRLRRAAPRGTAAAPALSDSNLIGGAASRGAEPRAAPRGTPGPKSSSAGDAVRRSFGRRGREPLWPYCPLGPVEGIAGGALGA
jgi:hypothetical protein